MVTNRIDHVLKNPQRYNLFKEQFITDSIERSRSVYELKARKEGEQTVLDNPGLFGLKLLDEEFKVTPYTKSWFFDEHLGWLWTNHQVFPYIYKAEKKSEPSAWLFLNKLHTLQSFIITKPKNGLSYLNR